MSHIPNSAMPHAMAEPSESQEQPHTRFNAEEWKAWGAEQLSRAGERLGPIARKVRNDPKLIAAALGTLALAAAPLIWSRRRHRHAFA
jgi:hypothetical protein